MYSIYFVTFANPKEKYEKSLFDIIHCLQIIRIFRLFRLVKNFTGFQVLMYAVKASGFEVMLMSMFLIVAMLMFGSFAFFSGDTAFPSIPDSFWWAVVTMTTVGYGDMVPTTGLSKLIGALCAVTGVCLLAIIIPIFVNNFVLFYEYSKVWRTASENKKGHVCDSPKAIKHIKVAPQTYWCERKMCGDISWYSILDIILVSVCSKPGPGFLTSYVVVFLVFNCFRWEMIFRFVDIDGIVDHHYLNFLFKICFLLYINFNQHELVDLLSYVTFYDILVLVLRVCIPSVCKYYKEVV